MLLPQVQKTSGWPFLVFACVVSADKERRPGRVGILRTTGRESDTEYKQGAFHRTMENIRRRLVKSRTGGHTPSLWDRQVRQTVACLVLIAPC